MSPFLSVEIGQLRVSKALRCQSIRNTEKLKGMTNTLTYSIRMCILTRPQAIAVRTKAWEAVPQGTLLQHFEPGSLKAADVWSHLCTSRNGGFGFVSQNKAEVLSGQLREECPRTLAMLPFPGHMLNKILLSVNNGCCSSHRYRTNRYGITFHNRTYLRGNLLPDQWMQIKASVFIPFLQWENWSLDFPMKAWLPTPPNE